MQKFANELLEIIVKMSFSFLGFNYRTNEDFAVKEIVTCVGCWLEGTPWETWQLWKILTQRWHCNWISERPFRQLSKPVDSGCQTEKVVRPVSSIRFLLFLQPLNTSLQLIIFLWKKKKNSLCLYGQVTLVHFILVWSLYVKATLVNFIFVWWSRWDSLALLI